MAEQLLADRLIEACELTNDRVTIVQGPNRHAFTYEQARAFMMGMVRGRSWTPPAGPGGDGAAPPSEPRVAASTPRTLRSALDDLASIAAELDVIVRYEHVENGSVNIALASCESELPGEEALAFLADCVLHRLKTRREEVEPIRAEAWSRGPQMQLAESGS